MNNLQILTNEIKSKLFSMSEYTKHQGMVGWLRSNTHKADYVYGEITGYFLSFCAYVYKREQNTTEKKRIENIIKNHVDWLNTTITTGLKTRYTLGTYEDWRNNALFAFDIAMIIRGLDDVKDIVSVSSVMAEYLEIVNKFISPSGILTSVYTSASEPLPQKWSTTFDVHLVKVAANLCGIPQWDNHCTEKTVDALKCIKFEELIKKDSHPIFYYLEGLLLLSGKNFIKDTSIIDYVTSIYIQLLAQGTISNNSTTKEYMRSDVLSQQIRIGSILYSYGKLTKSEYSAIEKLVDYLIDNFYDEGYICFFEKDTPNNYYNAWCAMFAYQALDLFLNSKEKMIESSNADFFYQSVY